EVFDWTVPKEWNIRDAYVENSKGERVVDFNKSNLHVVSYSIPVSEKMSLARLREHVFTLPEHPDWIPYRTSYYTESWGFCLSHNHLSKLEEGSYNVVIDSTLEDGEMNYGEYYIEGKSRDEVLISTHACHPSLCNDNLSGVVLSTFLAEYISRAQLRYSYRFIFIPGGIGSIVWLCMNEDKTPNIKHGLVIACVGDSGGFTYKKSRCVDAEIDLVVPNVLRYSGHEFKIVDFSPYGYDERNFGSPGFNLPVGSLTRSTHGQFPQHHTSADDLTFVQAHNLRDSFEQYLSVIYVLENNRKYLNTKPKGDIHLGKRGLYGATGGLQQRSAEEMALLWVLNMSDGKHNLLDISDRSGLPFEAIKNATDVLCEHKLLEEVSHEADA
ncbi:MAG: DUF4910 domain-containing protein, partial [Phycisphaerales bacterium]